MSSRNLEYLLAPHSVALIGASDRPQSVGAIVMRNLLTSGFDGPIWPVNLRHSTVAGLRAFRKVAELPETPELAVICTPARTVPGLITELGERGTRAALVISSGFDKSLSAAMLAAAKRYTLRILGPNCMGMLLPRIGLNASFAHTQAQPGHLAFIAQSGALTSAMLDWARTVRVGFSYFVSLGDIADVDFGDLLDVLCHDPQTHAILLYVESITAARKFMSAGRAAARNKPVIVVKAGRRGLANADDVYDAALRRAGMLRVNTTRELFDAAETLARMKPLTGERLAIVSNGSGPGVMAMDALYAGEGDLARDPINILGDAPTRRYVEVLDAVLADPNTDAALLIHAPTAVVSPSEIARSVTESLERIQRPVLTCWMGGEGVREAKGICAAAGVPTYSTPEEAVGAFLQAVNYRRNQQQLLEVPSSIPDYRPRTDRVRSIIAKALSEPRTFLTDAEAREVLEAYGIQVVTPDSARSASTACELIAGMTVDPTFGPVIRFGQGGADVSIVGDQAVALPPLNTALAAELISRTHVKRRLAGVNMRALEYALVQLAQLTVDIAELVELQINPLLADEKGVCALGARIRVEPAKSRSADRLAIRPYPKELEETVEWNGRTVLLRPLRPEDFTQQREFLKHVTHEDLTTRFFRAVRELPDSELAYLLQIDYERAMAFIAEATGESGARETLGVARAHADADNSRAEFAIIVRSDLKAHGLGSLLLDKLIRYCRERGIQRLTGDVLASNVPMLRLAALLGFESHTLREGLAQVSLHLNP